MLAVETDIAKLCADALRGGCGVFTYAGHLRVYLVYRREVPTWALAVVPMRGIAAPLLDAGAPDIAWLLCSFVEQRLGGGLRFDSPRRVTDSGITSWVALGTGGPSAAANATIDEEACRRLVRYAKRDGRGVVVVAGWQLCLARRDGRWHLDVAHADRSDTPEMVSDKHYALAALRAMVDRFVGTTVEVTLPSPSVFSDDDC